MITPTSQSLNPTDTAWLPGPSLSGRTVLAARLLPALNRSEVHDAPHEGVLDSGKVLLVASTHHDGRELLQTVTFTRNVAGDLHPSAQFHTGDLPDGRVRLLRGDCVASHANPAEHWPFQELR